MDEHSAAGFQFAGQDIPWLLRYWAYKKLHEIPS